MAQTFARAVLASAIALGTLVFSAGSAAPAEIGPYVYPYRVQPVVVAAAPRNGRTVIVREEPSLLTPADLHFSVDTENGVTVVRGPLAR